MKYKKGLSFGLFGIAGWTLLFGALIFIGFLEDTKTKTTGILFWRETVELYRPFSERAPYLVAAIVLWSISLICLLFGFRITFISRRYNKYITILSGNAQFAIQKLADITNTSIGRIIKDIKNMIAAGYLPGYYMDYKQGLLIDRQHIPTNTAKITVKCSKCGASNEATMGQSNSCIYCDSALPL